MMLVSTVVREEVPATVLRVREEDEPVSVDDAGDQEEEPQAKVDGEMDGHSLLVQEDGDPAEEDTKDEQADPPRVDGAHVKVHHR